MAIINLGRVGYVHKGEYNSETIYEKYDVVLYNHGSYLYIGESASSGKEPTNSLYWQAMLDPTDMNSLVKSASETVENLTSIIDSLTTPFEEEGNIVTCHPLANYQLQVYADIEPIQNGSGDPSPDNVQALVPRSSITVCHTGKNLFHAGNITVEDEPVIVEFDPPLQPGTYTFSATVDSNSQTSDSAVVTEKLNNDDGPHRLIASVSCNVPRGYRTFMLDRPVSKLYFHNASSDEVGVTTNWTDIQIEAGYTEIGSEPPEYEPYVSHGLKTVNFNAPVYAGRIHLNTGNLLTGEYNYMEVDGTWQGSFYINNNPNNPDTSYYVFHLTENERIAIDDCAWMSHYRNHPTLSFNDDSGVYNVFRYYNHNGLTRLAIRPDLSKYPTAADFKAYLIAQKAAGTPVQFAYKTVNPNTKETNVADGEVIVAGPGVNVLRSDIGNVIVNGRNDTTHQESVQNERISAVEEAVVNGGGSYTLPEPAYELIETIVVEEDMAIERSEEPDGTPYALDALFIKVGGTAASKQAVNLWAFSGSERVAGGYQSFTAGLTRYGAFEAEKHRGYWRSKNHDQSSTSTAYIYTTLGGQFYTLRKQTSIYPHITSWKTQGAVCPSGVTIEVWGVRA